MISGKFLRLKKRKLLLVGKVLHLAGCVEIDAEGEDLEAFSRVAWEGVEEKNRGSPISLGQRGVV